MSHSCFVQKVKPDTCRHLIFKMGKHIEDITAPSNLLTFRGPSPILPFFFTLLFQLFFFNSAFGEEKKENIPYSDINKSLLTPHTSSLSTAVFFQVS